jgi:hypothetical protein
MGPMSGGDQGVFMSRRFSRVAGLVAGVVALTAVLTGCTITTSTSTATSTDAGCVRVQILSVRGTGEQPGAGLIGQLATQIKGQTRQTSDTTALDYPATLPNYHDSVATGAAAVKAELAERVARCPNQKIVLLGYSQGAQAVGDALGGGGLPGTRTPAVDPALGAHVAAVILMGDPRHVPGQSFDAGSSTRNGQMPRPPVLSLNAYADRIQSYCDDGDPYCDRGSQPVVHLGYFQRYDTAATQFVLGHIGG